MKQKQQIDLDATAALGCPLFCCCSSGRVASWIVQIKKLKVPQRRNANSSKDSMGSEWTGPQSSKKHAFIDLDYPG